MVDWAISRPGSGGTLGAGTALGVAEGWASALAALMDELAADLSLTGCAITVHTAHAFLLAGRTASGELDHRATRAAAERLALTCSGADLLAVECPPGQLEVRLNVMRTQPI